MAVSLGCGNEPAGVASASEAKPPATPFPVTGAMPVPEARAVLPKAVPSTTVLLIVALIVAVIVPPGCSVTGADNRAAEVALAAVPKYPAPAVVAVWAGVPPEGVMTKEAAT